MWDKSSKIDVTKYNTSKIGGSTPKNGSDIDNAIRKQQMSRFLNILDSDDILDKYNDYKNSGKTLSERMTELEQDKLIQSMGL